MAHQPLVKGGVLGGVRYEVPPPKQFLTSTPPVVRKRTRVVAVASPDFEKGDPGEDGWFLSDFYALNYLYEGQGASQVWLTAADPVKLLKTYGNYLHGNPYEERKVVLSPELIQAGKLTRPTVVTPSEITNRFKYEIRKAAKEAMQDDGNLLVLMFCHGLKNLLLSLDATADIEKADTMDYSKVDVSKFFTIADLKEAAGPHVRMALITSACYSGGWLVHPDLNMTGMAAANQSTSMSWIESRSVGRYCGSIFVSALVGTLTSTASTLLPEEERHGPDSSDDRPQRLQPENPTEAQALTYNAFCHSLWDVLGRRLHRKVSWQEFTFKAQDDGWEAAWTDRTGMELERYEQRWAELPTYAYKGSKEAKDNFNPSPFNTTFAGRGQERTGGSRTAGMESLLMSRATKKRVRQLAKLFYETCPGDDFTATTIPMRTMLRRCMKTGDPQNGGGGEDRRRWNLFATVQYRIDMARLADSLIDAFQLPRPDNVECLMWDALGPQGQWISSEGFATDKNDIREWLFPNGIPGRTPEQGPPFDRFTSYLCIAIMLANKDRDTCRKMVDQINAVVEEVQTDTEKRVLEDPEVRRRGREWTRTIGRRVRESLSPRKRPAPADAPRHDRGEATASSSSSSTMFRQDPRGSLGQGVPSSSSPAFRQDPRGSLGQGAPSSSSPAFHRDPRSSLGQEEPSSLRRDPQGSPSQQRTGQPSASSWGQTPAERSSFGASRGQEWGSHGMAQSHRQLPSAPAPAIGIQAAAPGSPGAQRYRSPGATFSADAMQRALGDDDGTPRRSTRPNERPEQGGEGEGEGEGKGKGKGKGKEVEREPEDKEPGFW